MTSRIIRLSDQVKKKIAAGEVIEGPASVVKELLENAVDAGATSITIKIEESGLKKIQVTDDGSGIPAQDLPLAVEEHATSKITSIEDIMAIGTFGFRGEALSSISSVARLTIKSRFRDENEGSSLVAHDGKVELAPYAGPVGTMVQVENLFYSVPARKQFLKSPRAELRLVRDTVTRSALFNYHVAYTLEVDGKQQAFYPACTGRDQRVQQVYGEEVYNGCYHVFLDDLKVSLEGYLSKPHYLKSSRQMQRVYVNGRPVDYPYLGFHLSRAYEAVAFRGQYPVAIIFITIDPSLVDANIHPSKREVKLFDQRYIDQLIAALAGKALDQQHTVPLQMKQGTADQSSLHEIEGSELPFTRQVETGHQDLQGEAGHPGQVLKLRDAPLQSWKYLGTVFQEFLLAEREGQLVIVDFHAAHERFIFDRLMLKDDPEETQELLYPETVELPVDQYHVVLEEQDTLAGMGLVIEDFSDRTIVIRSIPASCSGAGGGRELLLGFIEELSEGFFNERDRKKAAAASMACHSARRRGDVLSTSEADMILEQVFSGDHELRCPHGRPFVYRLGRDDIEKMVKRQ